MRVALKPNDCRRTHSVSIQKQWSISAKRVQKWKHVLPLVCLLTPLVWGFQPSSITVTFAMNWGICCKPRYDPGIHCKPRYVHFTHLATGNIVSKLFMKLMVTKKPWKHFSIFGSRTSPVTKLTKLYQQTLKSSPVSLRIFSTNMILWMPWSSTKKAWSF